MNWANRITMIRIILIPIIITLMIICNFDNNANLLYGVFNKAINISNYSLPYAYLIAGILFIVASLTDALDGYIARKYNQITTFGKFFDSIADKLLTNSVLIVFAIGGIIPVWMCVILICRDFLIDVVRQILASSNTIMAADKLGKYRATFEMIGLTILFFVGFRFFNGSFQGKTKFDEYGWINQIIMIPMYITTVLCIASALNYIIKNKKVLFNTSSLKKED
ncbi:CDP-diacylglycerol--glycerol-3-phosphate 3-phosphatidyltransferase [Spiroplasma tabanidicola]|uniref:CDP-diacylglycerol--glycerol-3-phosphate 3-phosphatidyltransferase n=1 Tax=Spiroplasma tabanidicola TaxID=324079 RepID=A0A6I6C9P9_9MOLU|nr:CDP-diacylglycerol--glycerol-3-phosphate 3-phosphatidyltransferase [Spiroplasma tabanidicola]QGS52306.1 CDP-diacylglycerol-glycerol-3-phosphate 3-phosphatidyltransferase [Spiroplasma tabanidicola]